MFTSFAYIQEAQLMRRV